MSKAHHFDDIVHQIVRGKLKDEKSFSMTKEIDGRTIKITFEVEKK